MIARRTASSPANHAHKDHSYRTLANTATCVFHLQVFCAPVCLGLGHYTISHTGLTIAVTEAGILSSTGFAPAHNESREFEANHDASAPCKRKKRT